MGLEGRRNLVIGMVVRQVILSTIAVPGLPITRNSHLVKKMVSFWVPTAGSILWEFE